MGIGYALMADTYRIAQSIMKRNELCKSSAACLSGILSNHVNFKRMNNPMNFKKSIAVVIAALLVPVCFTSAQTAPPIVYSDSGSNIIVVTLHDGDSLIPKLTEVVNNYGIRSGLILAAFGQLRNFTLGYYEITLRKFYKKTYTGPYDLAVTQGIIAHATDGSLNMDIVTQCDSTNTDLHANYVTFKPVGGHLFGGIVSVINEIVIMRLDTIKLARDYHPENGTWDFDIATTGIYWRQDPGKAVNERTDLFGANSDAPVFDVAGRRINRLRQGRLEKVASGMYVVPQPSRKTGVIIKQ